MADSRRVAVYYKDTGGNSFYDSFTDINPVLNADQLRAFSAQVSNLTDGDIIKTVSTDTTTIFPTAGGGE